MAVKAGRLRNLGEAIRANELYRRGDEAWSKGHLRPAFRLFLAAARAGMEAAFSTVGNFYHNGIGVNANPDTALDWYRLAYRAGARSVANNIGCILRDRKKFGQAIEWFRRAVQQKDGDANLNIAKIYLHKGDLVKTRSYLDKTRRSPWATEQSKEEARSLLRKMMSRKADNPGTHRARKGRRDRPA
ncbi:MAG: tetratricopeptide repeat protein [Candidatus Acidiferrales bacterium]